MFFLSLEALLLQIVFNALDSEFKFFILRSHESSLIPLVFHFLCASDGKIISFKFEVVSFPSQLGDFNLQITGAFLVLIEISSDLPHQLSIPLLFHFELEIMVFLNQF
jgi:hypothetical protein